MPRDPRHVLYIGVYNSILGLGHGIMTMVTTRLANADGNRAGAGHVQAQRAGSQGAAT